MKTRDSLGFYWRTPDGHVEVAGLVFYGFFGNAAVPAESASAIQVWADLGHEVRLEELRTGEGNVVVLEVRFGGRIDDDQWMKSVETTLRRLVEKGAIAAWCGGEDCGWSLSLFDPTSGAGNVYAAFLKDLGFLCNAGFSDEFQWLTDAQLLAIGRVLAKRMKGDNGSEWGDPDR